MHTYATKADKAVIKPGNNPFENIANSINVAASTIVYSKLLFKTLNSFVNVFISHSFFVKFLTKVLEDYLSTESCCFWNRPKRRITADVNIPSYCKVATEL